MLADKIARDINLVEAGEISLEESEILAKVMATNEMSYSPGELFKTRGGSGASPKFTCEDGMLWLGSDSCQHGYTAEECAKMIDESKEKAK